MKYMYMLASLLFNNIEKLKGTWRCLARTLVPSVELWALVR